MSDLPRGWEWANLGDIATSVRNGIYIPRPNVLPDGVPILRINSVRPMRLDLGEMRYSGQDVDSLRGGDSLLSPGDLLFTRYSGSKEFVGACACVPDNVGALTYPDKLIRVKLSEVDSQYLAAAFSSPVVRSEVEKVLRTTAGQVGISGSSLKSVRVPLAPLAEQRRIVAALEVHLSHIDAGGSILSSLGLTTETLQAQTLAAALADSVSSPHEFRNLAPAGTNDGTLPRLPADWRWKRLGEIADVVGGITKDAKRQADSKLREVPYLRVANVQRGRLDLSQISSIRASEQKILDLTLRHGDVLLNEGGDRDKLARGWIWQSELPECIHQNHVFRARIRDGELHPKILAWHANTFGKQWAQANGKQSVNLASISLRMIRLMPVPIPPLSQQESIVATIEENLAAADRLKTAVENGSLKAEQLRRSLLTEAFAGRLVPQDQRDEPASVLLERIRAERAAQSKSRRSRSTAK